MAAAPAIVRLALFTCVVAGTPAGAATFNLAGDFQNAVFSYGFEVTLGGTLTPYTIVDSSSMPGITALLATGTFPGSPPYVADNTTGAPLNLGFIILNPNTLDLHPGPTGQYSVVRFTPSTAGSYDIAGLFSGLDTTTTDVHVLLNGSPLFSGAINAKGDSAPFSLVAALNTTDHLDFAVGFGANGDFFFDSTGLSGTISTTAAVTPEPATYRLIGAVLVMVGILWPNRKKVRFR